MSRLADQNAPTDPDKPHNRLRNGAQAVATSAPPPTRLATTASDPTECNGSIRATSPTKSEISARAPFMPKTAATLISTAKVTTSAKPPRTVSAATAAVAEAGRTPPRRIRNRPITKEPPKPPGVSGAGSRRGELHRQDLLERQTDTYRGSGGDGTGGELQHRHRQQAGRHLPGQHLRRRFDPREPGADCGLDPGREDPGRTDRCNEAPHGRRMSSSNHQPGVAHGRRRPSIRGPDAGASKSARGAGNTTAAGRITIESLSDSAPRRPRVGCQVPGHRGVCGPYRSRVIPDAPALSASEGRRQAAICVRGTSSAHLSQLGPAQRDGPSPLRCQQTGGCGPVAYRPFAANLS